MFLRRPTFVVAIAVAVVLALPGTALAASGDRDLSFNGDGFASLDVGGVGGSDNGNRVAVHAGMIIVAGDSQVSGGDRDIMVARFETDGDPDLTFGGGDGYVTTDLGFSENITGLAVLPNGRILVAGYYRAADDRYRVLVARYQSDGDLDLTFGGGDGIVDKDFGHLEGAAAYDVLLLPDGKFMVGGGVYPSDQDCDVGLWRFKASGKVDKTFSGDGMVTLSAGPDCDEAWRLTRMPDGDIVAGGWAGVGSGGYDVLLARFRSNGRVETSFGWDGMVTYNPTNRDDEYVVGMGRSGNKILVVAEGQGVDDDIVLLRVKDNGGPDRTFGGGDGEVVIDLGANEDPTDLVVQSDGKIVVAGSQGADMFVARFLPGGGPDGGFGSGGLATAALPGRAESVALQPNGRLVLVGQDGNGDVAVARFLP